MTATRPSLRGLGRHLGVTHACLSRYVHDGILTQGVGIDARGRAFVTDIEAAARQFAGVQEPPRIRREQTASRAPAPLTCRCVIWDSDGYDWSAEGLLAAYAAHDLLLCTLLRARLAAGEDAAAITASTADLLRGEAQLQDGCSEDTIAYSERVLASTISMLVEGVP